MLHPSARDWPAEVVRAPPNRQTAQAVPRRDGPSNDHVWAERYDRGLENIFELQDEISRAIVKALKLKLLSEEREAIEQRGTDNVEAYA